MIAPLPLAFGFVNFALLGWLAAAAAPILIHLWMRHTHRDTPWAAIEFLREAIKRNARKLRLQQWILLAIRTLVIILLVLAAAKPFLSGWNLLGAGPKVHRLLVFDASMSMQYEIDGQSRFARAQELAHELIERSPSGGVYSICVMEDPPRPILARPAVDREQILREIQNLSVSSGTTSLRETLALINRMLDDAARENRDIQRHEVVLFTDLGRHPWDTATIDAQGQPADAQVATYLADIAQQSKVLVVDVGSPHARNVAVSQLAVAGALATTAEPVQVAAQVTNYSAVPTENLSVQLVVDGRAIDEQTTTLAPAESTTLAFDIPFDTAAWHSVSVRTMGDSLASDDQAFLALHVLDRVRILCVEGEPHAARYVARALNPSGEPTSPLEPVVVGEGALAELPLAEFQCLFVCNVARFTPAEVRLLSNYVDRGGGLIIFLGDRVLADAYNETFVSQPARQSPTRQPLVRTVALQQPASQQPALQQPALQQPSPRADESQRPLLPASIGQLVTSESFGIDPLDYQHPIVAAFRGRERAGLLTAPISTYLQLTPHDTQGAEVALATTSGDPLLVTHPFGSGVVALVATAASLDTVDPATGQPWTLLPAWPSFLPIVRELVAYTSPLARNEALPLVGAPLVGQLPPYWADPTLLVERPDGRLDATPIERSGREVEWRYTATEQPGIYAARSSPEAPPVALAAVNVDPRESDLARTSIEQLPPSISLHTAPPDEDRAEGHLPTSTPLHSWLLQLALGLLLVESILAWWFGRGVA